MGQRLLLGLWVVLSLTGCYLVHGLGDGDRQANAKNDALPEPIEPPPCDDTPQVIDKVDLLFVVDNSGSMREEQASLRAQFPRLVDVLTSGDAANGTPTSRRRRTCTSAWSRATWAWSASRTSTSATASATTASC